MGVGDGVIGSGVGVAVGASVCTGGGRVGRGAATVATGATGAGGCAGDVAGAAAEADGAAATLAGAGVVGELAGREGGVVRAAVVGAPGAPGVGVDAGGAESPQPAIRTAVPPANRVARRRREMYFGLGMRDGSHSRCIVEH